MSFRKFNSFTKNEKKTDNSESPLEFLIRLFTKNPNDGSGHKRNVSCSFSTKYSAKPKTNQSNEIDFLWNLELVIIYTANLIRQKIDDLNRINLIQQLLQCAQYIDVHLTESQTFVDRPNSNQANVENIRESLGYFRSAHKGFSEWIDTVVARRADEGFDLSVGQDLFFRMEVKAHIFIEKLNASWRNSVDTDYKRSSVDNGSLESDAVRSRYSDGSRQSCFNDEDRLLIDKLKKLDPNIDLPPPKPAIPKFDEHLESHLNQVEQVVKSQKQNEYDYLIIDGNNQAKSLKIEDNCIMPSSMISNDIPPVDMDSADDFTPTPGMGNSMENGFDFVDVREVEPIPKIVPTERARNFPLPPVPCNRKLNMRFKLPQMTSNFPSEEIHYRKTSLIESEQSQVTNRSIINFNHQSPLRSPSLISSINFQNKRSPVTKVPSITKNRHSNNSIQLPISSPSGLGEGANFHSLNTTHQLFMAKQIPSIIRDPNDLLNINDMQDDIKILTRPFDASNIDDKVSNQLSEINQQTNEELELRPHHPNSLVITTNNDETYCNSEVKSDTEEYFEYIEIDGKKYRRKMKKRTVIKRIQIRKTILAPMKPDGSGPDFSQCNDNGDNRGSLTNDIIINNEKHNALKPNDQSNDTSLQPRFRRGHEDRFRVSKSMFYPYRDQMKRITLCHPPNVKIDSNNKLFPLMNKYMYRFGESDFEEPVIDKRFSTQLTDAVYSTWYKTSESILPHEKSKSIYYLKKSREKNDEGATVHNAVRVTASRTIRMKIPDNGDQQIALPCRTTLPISFNTEEEESIIDGEDSDTSVCGTDTSLCGTDTRRSQFDSCLLSSDEEKDDNGEVSFKSDSVSSEPEVNQSKRSTMEDTELSDLYLEESLESIPVPSQRCISSDSCFYSHSSYLSDTKDQYSFILKENNATQYLIFDEESKYGECDIAGGPVDALIVYACDGKDHLLFLGAFFDTYRTFIEPEELIYRLTVRYQYYRSKIFANNKTQVDLDYHSENSNDDEPEKKCKHVLSLLLTIIGKLKHDLTDHLHGQIQQFQNYLSDIKETTWVDAISKTIERQNQTMVKDDKIVQRLQQLSNQPFIPPELKSPSKELGSPVKSLIGVNSKLTILNFPSREIAEQITLLDWSKYRDVELTEILNLKDIVNCNLPGVIEYAKNFENVQYWTQSVLLDPDRISDRDRMCIKFLRIMKHLHRLNNFSSFIAILLAIQLLPTNKMFSKRVRSKIKEYDDYMKPPRFSGYKEDLKQAIAPCIPFLGIFYQDIVMLNIANPPYLDLEEIIRNTDKSNFSSNNNQLLLSNTINCGRIINFWRSFKQYIFLKNCNKDQDKIRYSIEPNEKILQFLNNFKESFDDATIQRMIKQLI